MNVFVKSALFAALGVGTQAIGSGAQQPTYVEDAYPRQAEILVRQLAWPADTHAVQLAKQIVEAKTDAEKDKLKDKLKETLNKQFDDRQKRHEKELEALEAQVKKLKEMVSKRQENKKEIIEERTKQLEREAKGLGW